MARNALAMMVSQVITWSATLCLTLYLPRHLGAATYGKLQFLVALMMLFGLFVDLGTSTLIMREVARDRSRASSYLVNTLLFKSVMALLAYVVFIATVLLMDRPPDVVRLAFIFGLGMMLGAIGGLMQAFLTGLEQVRLAARADVVGKVSKALLVLPLAMAGFGLDVLAWAILASGLLMVLCSGYYVLRAVPLRRDLISVSVMRRMIAASMPFFLFAVFAKVYDKIDVTMLSVMTRDEVVGWYGAAYHLFESFFFLPWIFYTVSFPVLSRLWAQNQDSFRQAVHRGFALLAAAAVGVCVPLYILAPQVVDFLYTQEKFPGTAAALRILAVALASMHLNTMFVMVLQATDRQARWTRAGAVAAVVNPAVNYLLIPPLGHLGAAVTTVITELMLLTLAYRACPKGIFDRHEVRSTARAMAAAAILAVVLLLVRRWGLLPALAVVVPVHLLAVIRLGLVSPRDLALMKGALGSRLGGKEAPRKAA